MNNFPKLLPVKPLAPLALFGAAGLGVGSFVLTTYPIPATYYVLVLAASYLPAMAFFVYLLLWVLKRVDYRAFDEKMRQRWRAARDFERRGLVSVECATDAECQEIFLQEKAWRDAQIQETQRPLRWLF